MKLKRTRSFAVTISKYFSQWSWRNSSRLATSIPPHNLGEIIEATIAYINNKDISISQLMKHIPGPDFPTGGAIIGKDILKQGYNKVEAHLK